MKPARQRSFGAIGTVIVPGRGRHSAAVPDLQARP